MKFECLRCGKCCRNLHIKTDLTGRLKRKLTVGLFLMPDERKLFPKRSVVPLYGAGLKGRSRLRPEVIYAYQILENRCPHLTSRSNCKIYDNRPISCRAFPLNVNRILDIQCTWVNQNFSEGDAILKSVLDIGDMMKFQSMIFNHIESYVEYQFMWIWDLKKKGWVRSNF